MNKQVHCGLRGSTPSVALWRELAERSRALRHEPSVLNSLANVRAVVAFAPCGTSLGQAAASGPFRTSSSRMRQRVLPGVIADIHAQLHLALVDPLAGLVACLVVAPHGATDLGDAVANGSAGIVALCCVYAVALVGAWTLQHFLPSRLVLRGLFGLVSSLHLREDLGGRFIWSFFLHVATLFWAIFVGPMMPWRLAVAWLAFWHTPRHFIRLSNRDIGASKDNYLALASSLVAVATTAAISLLLWTQGLIDHVPEWFIIGCIIGHAACTELWDRGFREIFASLRQLPIFRFSVRRGKPRLRRR